MSLTAIADDCDLLAFDEVNVGIPVVVNAHELFLMSSRMKRGLRAALA
jgi:hypothetical protein